SKLASIAGSCVLMSNRYSPPSRRSAKDAWATLTTYHAKLESGGVLSGFSSIACSNVCPSGGFIQLMSSPLQSVRQGGRAKRAVGSLAVADFLQVGLGRFLQEA